MSNEDLNQEIKFTADGSGVKAGVSEIKRDLASIGPAADKAGEAGAAGLNKIGAGGENAARKLDSVTKNMVSSLQRQIAAMEAGGTATREYQESIARLRGADVGALKPYLDQLDAAKRKAQEAANANKGLETSFGGLGTAAGLARSAIASALAGLTVGAVVGFVRNINDGVDALNDFKDATGASIENASALEDLALRTGTSMDVVTSAMVKFNQVLGDAKPGSAQELALKAIGLSAKELRELDPAEALRQTAVALSQYADDGNKARFVQEWFGRSIKETAPFLNDLAEKTELVGKVTAEQTAEAERFNKQLAEMSKNATDLARDLTGPLIAAVNEVVKKFKEGRAAGKGFFEIGWQNYKDQVSEFWTGKKPETGGATGSWDEPEEAPKPSVGNLPDPAAIKAQADAAKKAAEEVRKELGEQAKLMAELSGLTGSFADDWARLTKVFTDKSGVVNVEALTAAQAELLKKQPFMAAAAKAEAEARKLLVASYQEQVAAQDELNAAYVADSRAREAGRAAVSSYVRGIDESAEALRLEVSLMGLSEQARKTAIAQYRIELELKKQIEAIDSNTGFDEAQREEQRARARAAAAQASLNASTQVAIDEGKRMADSIENSLTDALLRGFESGKDFAKNFRDTVVNMFKTLVLRPVISAVINPVAQGISGLLGGGGGGLGSVASGLQTASNLNTLWGAGSQALYGASVGASGASLLGANAVGMVGGDALGALISANGAWAGVATGAQAAAQAAVAANAALEAGTAVALEAGTLATASGAAGGAAAGGGISGALGAIPGWGWALAGVAALAGLFGKKSTPHMGALAEYSAETGVRTSQTHGDFGMGFGGVAANEATKATVGNFAQTMGQTLDSVAKQFGQSARFTVATAFADDSSKDGAWGGLRIAMGDREVVNWNNDRDGKWAPREFADGEQGAQQYAAELALGMRQALEAMDLPEWADGVLDALGEAPSLESLSTAVAQINATDAALESMGKNLQGFSGYTDAAITALLQAAGGIEALTSGAQAYYDNFYTESERTANSSRDIADALAEVGLEMPRTRAEFRALVESQMALGEEGARAVAVLLGVSGAFASITEGAESMQGAFRVTADGLKTILEDAITNASSAAEASRSASQAFEESIYSGLQDSLLGDLSGLLSGAINPLIDGLIGGAAASSAALAAGGAAAASSMAAGGAIGASATAQGGAAAAGALASGGSAAAGAMVSGGSAVGGVVSSVLDQARAYVNAYAQIMADPAIKDVIGQISGMVGEVAGIAYTGINAGGGGGSWQSPGSPSAPAGGAEEYNKALRSIGDTIEDEIKRLRGLMIDDSEVSQEVLLARFGVATAQARAGDQEALALLPELSRSIEQATALNAVSSVELARMRGWLSGSLEETLKVLKLDDPRPTKTLTPATATSGALNRAPREMLVMAQGDGPIVPRAYNAAAVAGADDALARELQALRAEVKALRDDANANALSQQRVAVRGVQVLEEWDASGMPQPRNEGTTA